MWNTNAATGLAELYNKQIIPSVSRYLLARTMTAQEDPHNPNLALLEVVARNGKI